MSVENFNNSFTSLLGTQCIDGRISFYGCPQNYQRMNLGADILLYFSIFTFMAVGGTLIQRWAKHGVTLTSLPDVMSFQLLSSSIFELIHFASVIHYRFDNYPSVHFWRFCLFAQRFMLISLIGVYFGVAGQLFGINKHAANPFNYGYIFFFSMFLPLLGLIIAESATSYDWDNLYVDTYQKLWERSRDNSFHLTISVIIALCLLSSGLFLWLAVRRLNAYVKEAEAKKMGDIRSLGRLLDRLHLGYTFFLGAPLISASIVARDSILASVQFHEQTHVVLTILEVCLAHILCATHGRLFESDQFTRGGDKELRPQFTIKLANTHNAKQAELKRGQSTAAIGVIPYEDIKSEEEEYKGSSNVAPVSESNNNYNSAAAARAARRMKSIEVVDVVQILESPKKGKKVDFTAANSKKVKNDKKRGSLSKKSATKDGEEAVEEQKIAITIDDSNAAGADAFHYKNQQLHAAAAAGQENPGSGTEDADNHIKIHHNQMIEATPAASRELSRVGGESLSGGEATEEGSLTLKQKKAQTALHLHLSKQMARFWSDPEFVWPEWRYTFRYPNPVNEAELRIHHCITFVQVILLLFIDGYYTGYQALPIHISVTLFCWIRFATGPRFDLVSHFVIFGLHDLIVYKLKLLDLKFAAGPPKRFAQFIAAATALLATVLRYTLTDGVTVAAYIWGALLLQLVLHIFYDLCVGLGIFYLLVKLHLIPDAWVRPCKFNYEIENFDDIRSYRHRKSITKSNQLRNTQELATSGDEENGAAQKDLEEETKQPPTESNKSSKSPKKAKTAATQPREGTIYPEEVDPTKRFDYNGSMSNLYAGIDNEDEPSKKGHRRADSVESARARRKRVKEGQELAPVEIIAAQYSEAVVVIDTADSPKNKKDKRASSPLTKSKQENGMKGGWNGRSVKLAKRSGGVEPAPDQDAVYFDPGSTAASIQGAMSSTRENSATRQSTHRASTVPSRVNVFHDDFDITADAAAEQTETH
jgi:hypothetical protein